MKKTGKDKVILSESNENFVRFFGQIVRRQGDVYIIWDLVRKIGFSSFIEKRSKYYSEGFYEVGELVLFDLVGGEVDIFADNLNPKELPEGVTPLISVPAGPESPPPADESGANHAPVQVKRAANR